MTAPMVAMMQDPDSPAYRYAPAQRQAPAWQQLRDVHEGTPAIQRSATTYLPKWEAENNADWRVRIQVEVFPALSRTTKALMGMVFRRNPVLGDDIPESSPIREHWENIDGAGTHGDVFSRRLLGEGLLLGLGGILVDAPVTTPGLTLADEQALGVRPYWSLIKAESVCSARWGVINGETVLTQLVLEEVSTDATGRFGEAARTRWRVFRFNGAAVTWELWGEVQGTAIMLESGVVANQRRIPFAPLYVGDVIGPLEVRPPLLDLSYSVIAHVRVRSDRRHSLHKASVPILVTIGRDSDDPFTVGVNAAVNIPTGGDMKYVEHQGTALGEVRQELQDLMTEMAAQGLAMLQRETRAAETAEAKRLDKAEQDSALASAARALQDCLEAAFGFHARYLGEEPGSLAVNMDFTGLSLDAPTIGAYSALVSNGQLSLETLWQMLEEGNALPDDFDPVAEKTAIENAAAQEMAQSLDRQRALLAITGTPDPFAAGAAAP